MQDDIMMPTFDNFLTIRCNAYHIRNEFVDLGLYTWISRSRSVHRPIRRRTQRWNLELGCVSCKRSAYVHCRVAQASTRCHANVLLPRVTRWISKWITFIIAIYAAPPAAAEIWLEINVWNPASAIVQTWCSIIMTAWTMKRNDHKLQPGHIMQQHVRVIAIQPFMISIASLTVYFQRFGHPCEIYIFLTIPIRHGI